MQSAERRPIALNLNVSMVSFNPFVAINMFKKKKGDPKEFPNPGPVDRVAMKKKRVMWQEEVLCDFTLTTSDGKDFPVHQVHLACVSDYMRAMLNGKNNLEWSPFIKTTARAEASTTRVLILSKMINMNIKKTLYSSTDFPLLVLVCPVLASALTIALIHKMVILQVKAIPLWR